MTLPSSSTSAAGTPKGGSLARRKDFALGLATVRPSLRTVEGPGGVCKGEPRVIQVLVALADARGQVLSRDEFLELCWSGRIVGDDAINRAIAEVRRIAVVTGAGFEVETVPRIGYRITGVDWEQSPPEAARRMTRREVMVATSAGLALVAAGGAALVYRRREAAIDDLVHQGSQLQAGGFEGDRRAETLFREAIARDPRRADAWGWLAVVLHDRQAAREAALRAISIDPREPNARAVLAYQRRDLDAWISWEDTLLNVLADAPGNALALNQLTLFYQGVGRCRDSWSTNEQAIESEPFNPGNYARRALKHWIFDRTSEADKVADQSMALWPRNSIVWNARMLILACTDRAPAALALLDNLPLRPVNLTEPSVKSWRAALEAIRSREPVEIDRAIDICTAAALLAPGLAANAIMFLSYLGAIDPAYRVATGLFENRGSLVLQGQGTGIKDVYSSSVWGRTQFLFIPATKAFRDDPRFPGLCERMGHVKYWTQRGVWPDPFVRGAIDPMTLA